MRSLVEAEIKMLEDQLGGLKEELEVFRQEATEERKKRRRLDDDLDRA